MTLKLVTMAKSRPPIWSAPTDQRALVALTGAVDEETTSRPGDRAAFLLAAIHTVPKSIYRFLRSDSWCKDCPMKSLVISIFIAGIASISLAEANEKYAQAARDLDALIAKKYAYLDALPSENVSLSDVLKREQLAVHDDQTLLAYAERRIASLADHHAITASSFSDSWAVVPTYADLWLVKKADQFVVDAVRSGSPAEEQDIRPGEVIVAVDGVSIDQAVAQFWRNLGLTQTLARDEFAARVLVAGRRDRARQITVKRSSGTMSEVTLRSLYEDADDARPPVSVCQAGPYVRLRFNNSLGDFKAIAAFDEAMRSVPKRQRIVIDLRDTPSGGNTTVARAILGWFVDEPRGYQIHNRPAEERETGIARQWIEQVMPRKDMYRSIPPLVLVGRWTGSMGEGIAVGFDAIGAKVSGTKMAGLKGSVEDFRLGDTDLFVKLPTERLSTMSGMPREQYDPKPLVNGRLFSEPC